MSFLPVMGGWFVVRVLVELCARSTGTWYGAGVCGFVGVHHDVSRRRKARRAILQLVSFFSLQLSAVS